MKPLVSLLALAAFLCCAPLSAQEDLKSQIQKELDASGKSVLDKIIKRIDEQSQKLTTRITELEKSLKDKDGEITELKKKLEGLSKDGKKPETAPAPAALTQAFIGIAHLEPTADQQAKLSLKPGQGAQISTLLPGGPADAAGLKEGDIILQVAGKDVGSESLNQAIRSYEPGKEVELVVLRGAEKMSKKVTLENREKFVAKLSQPVQPTPAKKEKAQWGILVEETDGGLVIQVVEKELTGDAAKLKEGDILKTVNGKKVSTLAELRESMEKIMAGDEATLELARKEEALTIKVVAGREKGQAKLVDSKSAAAPKAEPAKTEPAKPETTKNEPAKGTKPEAKKPAYLGLSVEEGDGKVEVQTIQPSSAAASFGIKEKDVIVEINKTAVKNIDDIKKALQGKFAGDKIELMLQRGDQKVHIAEFVLGSKDKPAVAEDAKKPEAKPETKPEPAKAKDKGTLGISAQEADDGTVIISELQAGGAAEKAALQKNDIIIKVNGMAIKNFDDMAKALKDSGAGEAVAIVVRRGDKEIEIKVTLGKAS